MAFDPVTQAALISTGGSLLGGLFGGSSDDGARENRKQTLKLIREKGDAVREGAERSGFNPLTYLGATAGTSVSGGGGGSGPGPLASIGAALQTYGNAVLENAISEQQQERAHQSAIAQLDHIAKQQADAGGASRVVTQTLGGRMSLPAAKATAPAGSEFSGGVIDRRRDVEATDIQNTPGANVIENDWTAGPVYLPGSEPPETEDMLLSAPVIVPQLVHNWGARWDLGGEVERIQKARREREGSQEFWKNYRGPVGAANPASGRKKSNVFNSPVR